MEKKKESSRTSIVIVAGIVLFIVASAIFSDDQPTVAEEPSAPSLRELNATVTVGPSLVNLINNEEVMWKDCRVYLNDDYEIFVDIEPGGNKFNYSNFVTSDAERFNYRTTKPVGIFISCKDPKG